MASVNKSIIHIDNILSHKAAALSLSEILSSVDLENYEKATTTYRKPCYQRGLKKPIVWGRMLVESVLEGMSIGSLHLSEWSVQKTPDGQEPYIDSFYNIEDGQTRLNSLLEFKEGKFDTKYGSYEESNVRQIFDAYQVSVVLLSKNRPRVRDSDYFRRLNENFSRLQDGTQLTPSDRYWAWYESRDSNFAGSPIVNHTVGLLKDERFKDLFEEYMKVKNMERRENRKELANMVGFVSGAWKGAEYANSNYFSHVDIIQEPITSEDKDRIESVLFAIQNIFGNVLDKKCKYSGEQLGAMFKTTQKFTGSMMIDLSADGKSDEEKTDVAECWEAFINEYRKHKEAYTEKNWINDVYTNLSDGHKRNCKKEDFEARLGAVKTWWSEYEE
jgi:hypothetical protein